MRLSGCGLMGSSPERPGEDVGGFDASGGELDGDAADFLDRPADQRRRRGSGVGFGRLATGRFVFGGARLARWRRAAIMAKASMTSDTCRCQPCQERVSLWSSPNSFLAVSKLSSIAQRWPSMATSVLIGVPAGHQVEKKARSPSAILRRISRPRVHGP